MNFPKQSLLDQAPAQAVGLDFPRTGDGKTLWVTCYGFPAGQALALAQQYFEYEKGLPIADYFPKDQAAAQACNFIRIKFQSPKDVAIALGENGKVLDLNGMQIMMGVSSFKDGDLLGSVPAKPNAFVPPPEASKPASVWQRALVWIMDL